MALMSIENPRQRVTLPSRGQTLSPSPAVTPPSTVTQPSVAVSPANSNSSPNYDTSLPWLDVSDPNAHWWESNGLKDILAREGYTGGIMVRAPGLTTTEQPVYGEAGSWSGEPIPAPTSISVLDPALLAWLKSKDYALRSAYTGDNSSWSQQMGLFHTPSNSMVQMAADQGNDNAFQLGKKITLGLIGAMAGGAGLSALGAGGAGTAAPVGGAGGGIAGNAAVIPTAAELGGSAGLITPELATTMTGGAMAGGGGAALPSLGTLGTVGSGAAGVLGAVDSQAANEGGAAVWGNAGGGMTGTTVPTNAPGSVDLGSLGGIMTNPAIGQGAGNNPSGYIPPGANVPPQINEQVPPGTVTNPAIPTNTPTGLGSIFSQLPSGVQQLLSGLTSPQGIAGLAGLFNANNQVNEWDQMMKQLNSMYSTDSPYAKQMEETLARKDAAAGRNSQYGPRAAQLAANLTEKKANTFRDLAMMKTNANQAQNSGVSDIGGLLQTLFGAGATSSIIPGLSSGIQELLDMIGG